MNPALCKGDGLCCAKCPTDAIVLKHFTNEEIFNQIDAALSDSWSHPCDPAACAKATGEKAGNGKTGKAKTGKKKTGKQSKKPEVSMGAGT